MATYNVYTMERPGRPRLAVLLAASMLAGAMAMAWGLKGFKAERIRVPLEASSSVADWPISVRPPAGWTASVPAGAPSDVGVVFTEPTGRKRELAVVRGPELSIARPVPYAAAMLDELATWFSKEIPEFAEQGDAIPFGPLPGLEIMWFSRSRDQTYGAVTITPAGQTYALLLRSSTRAAASDAATVRWIAEAVEFPKLRLTTDVAEAAGVCGWQLDTLPGTRAVTDTSTPVPTLTLLSPRESQEAWMLTLAPLPLAPNRTPDSLLADIARVELQDPNLPRDAVERWATVSDLPIYHATIRDPARLNEMPAWLVATGNQSAALLLGRFGTSRDALADTVVSLVRSLRAAPETTMPDLADARQRGEALLAEVRANGLKRWLTAWARQDWWYLFEQEGTIAGTARMQYARSSSDAEEVWRIQSEQQRPRSDGSVFVVTAETVTDRTGTAYVHTATAETRLASTRSPFRLRRPDEERYQESRQPDHDVVRKSLSGSRTTHQSMFQADATFASEPVLDIVCWLVASDPERRPAVVTTADRHAAQAVTKVLMPLGPRPIPGQPDAPDAPAVLIWTDCRLEPQTLYFNGDGVSICIDIGKHGVYRLCTEQQWEEAFPDAAGLSPLSSSLQ
ncbi:MAG: hypothetical protein JXA69_16670 [Phycisphaerae bacterium]|nr:hypothetical protein [Phycisphaerae bacterium]